MIKRKGPSCLDTLQNIKVEVCDVEKSEKSLFQSYKNIYLTGFNQCTIAQIRIKLTVDADDIEICSKWQVSNKKPGLSGT